MEFVALNIFTATLLSVAIILVSVKPIVATTEEVHVGPCRGSARYLYALRFRRFVRLDGFFRYRFECVFRSNFRFFDSFAFLDLHISNVCSTHSLISHSSISQSLNLSSLIPLLPCLSFIVPLYASLSMCSSSHVAARVSVPPFPNKYLTFRFSYVTRVCAFQLSPIHRCARLQARDSISSFPRCQ